MGIRVKEAFDQIVGIASRRFPWISDAKLRYCPSAEKDHRESWRQFAHTNHRPRTVCFARAAETALTWAELRGMIAHELGHMIALELGLPAHLADEKDRAGDETPHAVQDEADYVARELLGIPVRYNRRTLQEISIPERIHARAV